MTQKHTSIPSIHSTRFAFRAFGLLAVSLLAVSAFGAQAPDCNHNGVPDAVDLNSATSLDCNGNGVPDECDLEPMLGFEAGETLPRPSTPLYLSLVDLDRDGDLDVLQARPANSIVEWLRNDGAGHFAPYSLVSAASLSDLAAVDVDGDGELDLVLAGLTTLRVWRRSNGVLSSTWSMAMPFTVGSLEPADVDGDGDVDFVSAYWSDMKFHVLFNDGTGHFTPSASYGLPGEPRGRAALADLDLDGDIDAAFACQRSHVVSSWRNDGTGSFDEGSTIEVAEGPMAILAAELDDLPGAELAVTCGGAPFAGSGNCTVLVLASDHGLLERRGLFEQRYVGSTSARAARAADFDGDGDLDLAAFGNGNYVLVLANRGDAEFELREAVVLSGSLGNDLVAGDIDADGDADLVGSTSLTTYLNGVSTYSGMITVARNEGGGHFDGVHATPEVLATPIAGDFDADGDLDLVGRVGPNLRLERNVGGGVFAGGETVASAFAPNTVSAGDLDGDGWLDLLAMLWGNDAVYVIRNLGAGSFAAPIVIETAMPYAVLEVADLDGDGDRDIVWTQQSSVTVGWIRNQGDGSFRRAEQRDLGPDVTTICGAARILDVDADHDLDLVVPAQGTLELLRNDGTGNFGSAERLGPVTNEWVFAHVLDADLDGDLDLVAHERRAQILRTYLNDGAGHFLPVSTFAVPYATGLAAAGDVDGDGRTDFVLAGALPTGVRILRSTPAGFVLTSRVWPVVVNGLFPSLADLDGDGRLDVLVTGSSGSSLSRNLSLPASSHDCNANGLPDECDLAAGSSSDADLDGTLDECQAPFAQAFCSGDGSASPCPCGNSGGAGRGCANSVESTGALLVAAGQPSIADDTLVLHASGMPDSTTILFQGTERDNGGLGTPMLDGLRCVSGTIVRLGSRPGSAGAASYPDEAAPSISTRGGVLEPGTRTYQIFYRNAVSGFCPPGTGNWTNGIAVTWVL